MMIIVYLMLMVLILAGIFIVGWFIISPATEWLGKKVLALSIKGADYHAIVKAYKESGEVQQQST